MTRLKYEEIKTYIETNSKCLLLTNENEYENTNKKLDLLCHCGNKFKIRYVQFKGQNKRQCNDCGIKIRKSKLTFKLEDVISYINDELSGNGCTYISGNYESNISRLNIKCKCGINFNTTFSMFKHANKKQCKNCGDTKKGKYKVIPYEKVKLYIIDRGFELLTTKEEYIDAQTKISIKCNCGELITDTFSHFKHRKHKRCYECYRKELTERKLIPYEKVKKYVEVDSKSNCKLVTSEDEYINSRLNVVFQCNCGNNFETSFHEFKSGNKRQCNTCGAGFQTVKDFLEYVEKESYVNNFELIDYQVTNGYVHQRNKLKIKCSCGEIFETTKHTFERGKNRCGICSSSISKGEEKIKIILEKNQINFIPQFYFKECRGVRKPLPFDFAVFDEFDNIVTLIEYDGKQHFEPVNFGGCSDEIALLEYENVCKNDHIKNTYCKRNKLKLIRIPYWDFDRIEVL